MTIEDVLRTLEIEIDENTNQLYKINDTEKTTPLQFTGYFGQSYTYKNGNYAPENYMKDTYGDKYESLENKKIGDTVQGSAYIIQITESAIVEQGSTIYNLLFEGTTKNENNVKAYWLASPGVYISSNTASFGLGAVCSGLARRGRNLFSSNARWSSDELGVCPVIALKSEITLDQVTKKGGVEEAEWSSVPEVPKGSGTITRTEGQVKSDT